MQRQKSASNNHIPQALPKTKHHWSSFPPQNTLPTDPARLLIPHFCLNKSKQRKSMSTPMEISTARAEKHHPGQSK